MDALEKEIKQLKSETSSYMKKRQKNELTVAELTVLFTAFTKTTFDKEAFITGEKNGEATYKKYLRDIPMERVMQGLQKHSYKVVAATINRTLGRERSHSLKGGR